MLLAIVLLYALCMEVSIYFLIYAERVELFNSSKIAI
jgi:hypothetical protein